MNSRSTLLSRLRGSQGYQGAQGLVGASGSGGGGSSGFGGGGAGGHQWLMSSFATPHRNFSASSIAIQGPQDYYGISQTQKCRDCGQEFTQGHHTCMAGLKNILEGVLEDDNHQ